MCSVYWKAAKKTSEEWRGLRYEELLPALKKHVTFRKAWQLDEIDNWIAPEASLGNIRID